MAWKMPGDFLAPGIKSKSFSNRRAVVYFSYQLAMVAFCLLFGAVVNSSPFLSGVLMWTFVQGESSYIGWHYLLGLGPWQYLPIVISTGTINLIAFWLILFRGNNLLVRLPIAGRLFNPNKHKGFSDLIHKRRYIGLFICGLVTSTWWVGFSYMAGNRVKWGLTIVLVGNIVKLSAFTTGYYFALSSGSILAVILVVAITALIFAPRVLEKSSNK